MSSKDLAIGVLSTTAVILFVGLIILYSLSDAAFAQTSGPGGGVGVETGDYVMAVGAIDTRTQVLMVIDTAVNGMNVYGFDFKSGAVGITQQIDLGQLRAQAQQMNPATGGGRRR